MPVSSLHRARLMEARLTRELRDGDVSDADVRGLIQLHAAVMEPRHTAFADDHHPAYLHPARNALIVLRRVESPDVAGLALALVMDSELEGDSGPEALASLPMHWAFRALEEAGSVLLPGHPGRLESLVVAPAWARSALLSERLDHLRHLHLWRGSVAIGHARSEVTQVDLPAAGRSDPGLTRLLKGWLRRTDRYDLGARARERPPGEV